jgi:hypothetical protein
VTDDFRIGGGLPQGGEEKLRDAHGDSGEFGVAILLEDRGLDGAARPTFIEQ